jgi:hypothetical protein
MEWHTAECGIADFGAAKEKSAQAVSNILANAAQAVLAQSVRLPQEARHLVI